MESINNVINLIKPNVDMAFTDLKGICLGIQNKRPWQLVPSLLLGITTIFACSHLLVS